MKVLVTGANGFLGSWLVRKLTELNHDVRILVRGSSDLSELEGLSYEKYFGDITNLQSVEAACQGVQAVFHLAGLVAYTRKDRKKMEDINVEGTRNVVKACQSQNVDRLVHVSSVTAIGASFDGIPLNEKSPFNISHLDLGYFETKREAEEIVMDAVKNGLDAVAVNPSTIYGPGDFKKGSRRVQLKVAKGEFSFYTPGGVNVVSVGNVVDGIIKAWEQGSSGERYILAGENITIKRLFEIIANQSGVKPPNKKLPKFVLHLLGGIGDLLEKVGSKGAISSENAWTSVLFHWFDSSKAQKEIGFKPGKAEDAIAQSVNWAKENNYL